MRDLENILLGVREAQCQDSQLPAVWAHEALHILGDRLDRPQRARIVDIIVEAGTKCLGVGLTPLEVESTKWTGFGPRADAAYAPCRGSAGLRIEAVHALHEACVSPGDLILHEDNVEHLARSVRALRRPRGNMLVITNTQTNAEQIASLAFEIAGVSQIKETASHKGSALIKEALIQAGTLGVETGLLVTEQMACEAAPLEAVNSFLSTGHVGGLVSPKEMGDVSLPSFKANCREYLHIIVVANISKSALFLKQPALCESTYVDRFLELSESSLRDTAHEMLSSLTAQTHECVDASLRIFEAAKELCSREGKAPVPAVAQFVEFLLCFKSECTSRSEQKTAELTRLRSILNGIDSLHTPDYPRAPAVR